MKINYDKTIDALYIYLKKSKVAKTVEMNGRLIIDLDKKGDVVGIELLDASEQLSKKSLESQILRGINIMYSTPLVA